MDLGRLKYLYRQYQVQALTDDERSEWESIVQEFSYDEALQELLDSDWQQAKTNRNTGSSESLAQQRIYEYIVNQKQLRRSGIKIRKWIPYAAAAIVVFFIGFFLLYNEEVKKSQPDTPVAILPGGNRATLVLADGRSIDLSESQSGIVVGEELRYTDGSLVLSKESISRIQHLTMKIPKGGTYQVTLPDGTKVWLNSESTLRYPSRFGDAQRAVQLKGEAYFEVAKDKKRPFRVATAGQNLEVLGTQFNITAYDNEPAIKTTLVEGSVKITNLRAGADNTLKPGQQSVITDGNTAINEVSIEQFTAWKEGFFSFEETPFDEVLEQLARWYDVDIEYRRKPNKTFSGKMKRNARLSSVLDFFEGSGISFQLVGRRLIIE
ncbi:FecR family protein [Parapedobacter indicus]|uniref:FecR family protein n=1 Tax=Parapedobacter indicus TaxID=1477437 RepID=A0A1I3LMC5_9SPHI|nr:FecR family protein [Parapedobacter indicus]PPL01444.1 FecR family protein [Parapedobacter indicus]SFI85700.1 FecR family protein [Parapedobacter indicus]